MHAALSSVFAGDLERAAQELDLALSLLDQPRTESERAIAAYALSHRALVAYLNRDHALGAPWFTQSIYGLRDAKAPTLLIILLSDAAGWLLRNSDVETARRLLYEALNEQHRSPISWAQITPLAGLTLIDAWEGRSTQAAQRLGAIAAMAARAGLASAPNFQSTLDQAESLVTNSLGQGAFPTEWKTGRRNPAPVVDEAFTTARNASALPRAHGHAPRSPLTAREREVLGLIVSGRNDRAISAALFISEGTVSNHVSTILQKLDAVSRADAAVRAVASGWSRRQFATTGKALVFLALPWLAVMMNTRQ